jgi:hypothetical protein
VTSIAQAASSFEAVDGQCEARSPSTANRLELGATWPDSTWSVIGRVEVGTPGGLTQPWFASAEGTPIAPIDGETPHVNGEPCWPARVGDLVVCLPDSADSPSKFADAACEVPLADDPTELVRTEGPPSRGQRFSAFEVWQAGDLHVGPSWRTYTGGDCVLEGNPGGERFTLVPWDPPAPYVLSPL